MPLRATSSGRLQTTGPPGTGPSKGKLREAARLEKRCPELSEGRLKSITHLTTELGSLCPLSAQEVCPGVTSTLPSTLTHLLLQGGGSPPSRQGTVELSSQPRAEGSLHRSPLSLTPPSSFCPTAAGSSCWLELFIIRFAPDFADFELSWPGDSQASMTEKPSCICPAVC